MIVDRDSSWKPHIAGQEKFSRVPLNVASLANISDAACSNLAGDVSERNYEVLSSENEVEGDDREE